MAEKKKAQKKESSGSGKFILGAALGAIGGAIAGAAVGLLFAPEKGDDVRKRIADALREQGVKLKGSKLDNLVDEVTVSVLDVIPVLIAPDGVFLAKLLIYIDIFSLKIIVKFIYRIIPE